MEEKKIRTALILQYDGTGFNGFQIQNEGRTVQEELEKALNILYKDNIRIIPAGRTDAGVHALGQVVHYDADKEFQLKKLCSSLNGILANDISVKNANRVPSSFHARYSAVQREYAYLIYNHPQRNPLLINKALWVRNELNISTLKYFAQFFTGEKDFASFCKRESPDENTVRRIDEFEIIKNDELVTFRIRGTAFLRNMIRIIIGTILEMIYENKDPELVNEIIKKKDRNAGGRTAPPYGLYLNKIYYQPPLSDMESAF